MMTANPRKSGAFQIRAAERSRDSFILWSEGYTRREISEKMGLSMSTVQKCIERAKKKFDEDTIETLKKAVKTALQKKLRQCNRLLDKAKDVGEEVKVLEQYRKFAADISKICGLNENKIDITTAGEPINFIGKEWGDV